MTRRVELVTHDPAWALLAAEESALISFALGSALIRVEHVGSTSISDLLAKPTIDLMPIVTALDMLDACENAICALGYAWRGEWGIPGRRYCVRECQGRRLFHLHCVAVGDPAIEARLAFRDYMRANPLERRAYEAEKRRAAAAYPNDTTRYHELKSPWIAACETRALNWARGSRSR